MSRLGEGGEKSHLTDRSSAGGCFLPSAGYGEGTELGGRSPVGRATVNAFLEATAKVSTASATTAATASEASANDEVGAMRAIRDSTLALSVSRGADAPVDETSLLKSTSSRSVDAGDTGVRLAESRVEPGAPAAFRAREASPERLDPDHTGRFETPPVVEFDAATRTLTVRGRVETEATLRDHPCASLARRVVFAEGVFSGFFPARDASLAVRASAGDPTRDATRASTRVLRWARGASPRATALEFRDRGTGTLAFVDAVARGGWRAESGRARDGAAAGPIRAPGLESLRVATARGATSRGRRSVFFRSYAIHRFPTLQFVDDIAVNPEARVAKTRRTRRPPRTGRPRTWTASSRTRPRWPKSCARWTRAGMTSFGRTSRKGSGRVARRRGVERSRARERSGRRVFSRVFACFRVSSTRSESRSGVRCADLCGVPTIRRSV